jgi:DNA invertase Pin-like site-specific DNA recombinase
VTIKAAVWFRVSTDHQDAKNQEAGIAQFTADHGYTAAPTRPPSSWEDAGLARPGL